MYYTTALITLPEFKYNLDLTFTVNAEITLLYWQVGKRIHTKVLQGKRAEYGKQILVSLSEQLTQTYGKGWGERQLRHYLQFAETFPNIAFPVPPDPRLLQEVRDLNW